MVITRGGAVAVVMRARCSVMVFDKTKRRRRARIRGGARSVAARVGWNDGMMRAIEVCYRRAVPHWAQKRAVGLSNATPHWVQNLRTPRRVGRDARGRCLVVRQ